MGETKRNDHAGEDLLSDQVKEDKIQEGNFPQVAGA